MSVYSFYIPYLLPSFSIPFFISSLPYDPTLLPSPETFLTSPFRSNNSSTESFYLFHSLPRYKYVDSRLKGSVSLVNLDCRVSVLGRSPRSLCRSPVADFGYLVSALLTYYSNLSHTTWSWSGTIILGTEKGTYSTQNSSPYCTRLNPKFS